MIALMLNRELDGMLGREILVDTFGAERFNPRPVQTGAGSTNPRRFSRNPGSQT